MMDTLNLIPKSIAPAAIAYVGMSLVLGDLFTDRLARWVHIPKCQEALATQASQSIDAERLRQQAARDALGSFLDQIPALRQLPGVGAIEQLARSQSKPTHAKSFESRCACLASAARAETRFDQTLWVASLRFLEPASVSDFQGVMNRLDRQGLCSGGRS